MDFPSLLESNAGSPPCPDSTTHRPSAAAPAATTSAVVRVVDEASGGVTSLQLGKPLEDTTIPEFYRLVEELLSRPVPITTSMTVCRSGSSVSSLILSGAAGGSCAANGMTAGCTIIAHSDGHAAKRKDSPLTAVVPPSPPFAPTAASFNDFPTVVITEATFRSTDFATQRRSSMHLPAEVESAAGSDCSSGALANTFSSFRPPPQRKMSTLSAKGIAPAAASPGAKKRHSLGAPPELTPHLLSPLGTAPRTIQRSSTQSRLKLGSSVTSPVGPTRVPSTSGATPPKAIPIKAATTSSSSAAVSHPAAKHRVKNPGTGVTVLPPPPAPVPAPPPPSRTFATQTSLPIVPAPEVASVPPPAAVVSPPRPPSISELVKKLQRLEDEEHVWDNVQTLRAKYKELRGDIDKMRSAIGVDTYRMKTLTSLKEAAEDFQRLVKNEEGKAEQINQMCLVVDAKSQELAAAVPGLLAKLHRVVESILAVSGPMAEKDNRLLQWASKAPEAAAAPVLQRRQSLAGTPTNPKKSRFALLASVAVQQSQVKAKQANDAAKGPSILTGIRRTIDEIIKLDEANFLRLETKFSEFGLCAKLSDDAEEFEKQVAAEIAAAELEDQSKHVESTGDWQRTHEAELEVLLEEHRKAVALTREYQFHVRRKGLGSLSDMIPHIDDDDEEGKLYSDLPARGMSPEPANPESAVEESPEVAALRATVQLEQDTVAAVRGVHDRELAAVREQSNAFAQRRTALDSELRTAARHVRRLEAEAESLRATIATQGKRAAFMEALGPEKYGQYKPLQRRFASGPPATLEALMAPTVSAETRNRLATEEREYADRQRAKMTHDRPDANSTGNQP